MVVTTHGNGDTLRRENLRLLRRSRINSFALAYCCTLAATRKGERNSLNCLRWADSCQGKTCAHARLTGPAWLCTISQVNPENYEYHRGLQVAVLGEKARDYLLLPSGTITPAFALDLSDEEVSGDLSPSLAAEQQFPVCCLPG